MSGKLGLSHACAAYQFAYGDLAVYWSFCCIMKCICQLSISDWSLCSAWKRANSGSYEGMGKSDLHSVQRERKRDILHSFLQGDGVRHAVALYYWFLYSSVTYIIYCPYRCCSFVGFLNYGCQLVSIGQYCLKHATILHEIGHVIGFWHEQSRPDRDEHISVLLYNINPRYLSNFLKKDRSQVDSMGVPYDYNSIMHYPETAFSRQPGLVTLLSKEWGIPLGNAHELSYLDVLQANKLYRCGKS